MKKLKFSFKVISELEEEFDFTYNVIESDNIESDYDEIIGDILFALSFSDLLPAKIGIEGEFKLDLTAQNIIQHSLIVDNKKIDVPIDVIKNICSWSCFTKEDTIEAKKIKALNEFAKQYPQSTSGDLQTFVLGMNAMQNLLT